MNILGIVAYGMHDSAAALVVDGKLLASAEEERFNRKKFFSGFPHCAIDFCLKSAGLEIDDIDYIAYYINITPYVRLQYLKYIFRYLPGSLRMIFNRNTMISRMANIKALIRKQLNYKGRIVCVDHHLTHAANAFLVSPFERASILTIDGVGEIDSLVWAKGEGKRVIKLHRNSFPHSLGHVYLAFTQYLGFMPNSDEYKVMGLSAYGKPTFLDFFRDLIRIDGRNVKIDLSYFRYQFGQEIRFSRKLEKKLGIRRSPQEPILDKHKDIACSLQLRFEEVILSIVRQLIDSTGETNLCLAGGVALNSVANGKIAAAKIAENIYIPPTAADPGCAIGAAFYVYNTLLGKDRVFALDRVDFGPEYDNKYIESAILDYGLGYSKPEDLFKRVALLISQGKVVGWFQGRMEIGQRALGFRSILADPRRDEMRDIVNIKVKFREEFRPFAPVVLEEKFKDYFQAEVTSSPFMTMVFPVKNKDIPAVTHVDGTARVQTVSHEENAKFWNLINEFYKITKTPVLLNTSFNLKNEPIVNTPQEAINCFLRSEIDYLVLGDFLIDKNGKY